MYRQIRQEIKAFKSYEEIDGQIDIPDIQRSIMDDHVTSMATHIMMNRSTPFFGAIDLVNLNGKLYVIDGQHRLSAIERVYRVRGIVVEFFAVIYHVNNHDDMVEIFKMRNKNIPVPQYIMDVNDNKLGLLKDIQNIIIGVNLFDNKHINRPYININNFMESLRKSKLISIINSRDDFISIFHTINEDLRVQYTDLSKRKKLNISETMYTTARENGIFFGLDKNTPWFSFEYDIEPLKRILNNTGTAIN